MKKLLILIICFLFSVMVVDASDSAIVYVNCSRAILHTEPANESPTVEVPYMTELINYGSVTNSDSGSWVKVGYNNSIYYIWTDAGKKYFSDEKSSPDYIGNNKYQQDVIDKALYIYNNWDTKYEHWQSNGVPDTDGKYGFDCSGFVNYVLTTAMKEYVPTYRLSANIEKLYNWAAIYNIGKETEFSATTVMEGELTKELLVPGDIIFFMLSDETDKVERGYDHCGIYLGNNEFIHSTTSWGGGVCIMPLSDIYMDGFICVKRYIPNEVMTMGEDMYTASINNKIYKNMNSDEEPVAIIDAGLKVDLLYSNESWGYIEYEEGKYGYILLKNLDDEMEILSEHRYVSKTSLKLYEDYTTESDYLEVLIGTRVEYKGRYSNSSYYKVVYEGKEYYVYAPNGIDERLTDDYEQMMKGTGKVTVIENTNFRSTPSTKNSENILYLSYKDEGFTLIAQSDSGTWCYVKDADGQCGFLLSDKLTIELNYKKGDVNTDGSINAQDALMILKRAAFLISLTEQQSLLAEMNDDKMINAHDALIVLKIAARINI